MCLIRYFAAVLTLALAACAQTAAPASPGQPALIRICDGQGCSDRSRSSATFDAARDDNPEETRQLMALTAMAERDPRAAYDLGLRYFRGDGVTQNSYQAIEWMRRAGERGNLKAQAALGRFYLMGLEEMGSDPQEAEKWLSMAAGRGDKQSAKLLREASAAKQQNQADYQQWVNLRRAGWYGYWQTGYVYYSTWGPSGWYYR